MASAAELCEQLIPIASLCRPRTRAECEGAPRPCPFVGCRFHLLLAGDNWVNLRVNRAAARPSHGRPLWEWTEDELESALRSLPATCILDVIDEHPDGVTLDEAGQLLGGFTRERIRQIEAHALERFQARSDERKT